jgi:sugar-specific transcriptional regulator TrmB
MTAATDYARAINGRAGDGEPSAELSLMSFGFTEMESKLYCELLRSGPASGYRLAQRIAKAAANVYQALKTLAQKGAITASEGMGEATTYSPTPPDELLSMLRQTFEARQIAARATLENIRKPASDERVYSVPSVALVFERARSMLAQAENIVLIDFFPSIHDLLAPELDAARARGVTVGGIAYDPRHVDPRMPLNHESIDLVVSRWAGQGMMLVIDGRQLLLAQLSYDLTTVLNAVWTDSAFLSCIFHSGLAADIRLVAMRSDPSDPMQILTLQQSRPLGLDQILREKSDDTELPQTPLDKADD